MVGMGSFSFSPLLSAASSSDMRLLRGGGRYFTRGGMRLRSRRGRFCVGGCGIRRKKRLVFGRVHSRRSRRIRFNRCFVEITTGGAFRRGARRQDRLFLLDFQMSDLLLDLGLEFVRGPLELVQILPDLACDLRQLLWPEDDESQKEQEDRLGKAHAVHHTAGVGKAAITCETHW